MPEEFQHAKIQSPILNWKYREWISRLTENEAVDDVDPVGRPTAHGEKDAEIVQDYLQDLWNQLENARGSSFQRSVMDGAAIDCYGVYHWYLGSRYQKVDDFDYDELDDLGEEPDDPKLKSRYADYVKRYTEDEYEDGVMKGKKQRSKGKKYRERTESYLDRMAEERAKQGPVWCVETPLAEQIYPEEHRGSVSQFRRVLYVRQLDVATWWAARQDNDKLEEELLGDRNGPGRLDVGQDDHPQAVVGQGPLLRVHRRGHRRGAPLQELRPPVWDASVLVVSRDGGELRVTEGEVPPHP
jgi:hypothetical protein